jgi:hypothetical protein
MRLLRHGIGLRVPRTHRNTPEAQAACQLSDTAFVQLHLELARDPFTQINQSPSHNAIRHDVGTGPHPVRDGGLLPG